MSLISARSISLDSTFNMGLQILHRYVAVTSFFIYVLTRVGVIRRISETIVTVQQAQKRWTINTWPPYHRHMIYWLSLLSFTLSWPDWFFKFIIWLLEEGNARLLCAGVTSYMISPKEEVLNAQGSVIKIFPDIFDMFFSPFMYISVHLLLERIDNILFFANSLKCCKNIFSIK